MDRLVRGRSEAMEGERRVLMSCESGFLADVFDTVTVRGSQGTCQGQVGSKSVIRGVFLRRGGR